MSPIVYRMNAVLSRVVQRVPLGTNLGLFHCLWMLLSGRLLLSRSAVIPGLAALGLADEAVRRAWAALAYGKWCAPQLLEAWEHLLHEEQRFHAHQYGGYRPVACDLVGFVLGSGIVRPSLIPLSLGKRCRRSRLGLLRALGLSVRSGWRCRVCSSVARPRTPVKRPCSGACSSRPRSAWRLTKPASAIGLSPAAAPGRWRATLCRARTHRLSARRATLPVYQRKGRKPVRGALVRPLPAHLQVGGTPLLPRHQTAVKRGSFLVMAVPPSLSPPLVGMTWSVLMRDRAGCVPVACGEIS